MKAYYLLAPLGAIALAGCTVYRPVAYEPVVTTPATVAVSPTYVTPPNNGAGRRRGEPEPGRQRW